MRLEEILQKYNEGSLSLNDFKKLISFSYVENVEKNIAKLDINREIRRGIPEIIYGDKKEYSAIVKILTKVLQSNDTVVISRISKDYAKRIQVYCKKHKYYFEIGKYSSTILLSRNKSIKINENSKIGIFSAGTSDIGIAEEARLVSKAMGCHAITSYDVGVAGIHRIFASLKEMINQNVNAIIVVAGMEGALPSIVSSCVDVPVIGVPTSIGYGFGSDGIAALSSMLQSCSLGLSVVNIDNGIGAGAYASLISNRVCSR